MCHLPPPLPPPPLLFQFLSNLDFHIKGEVAVMESKGCLCLWTLPMSGWKDKVALAPAAQNISCLTRFFWMKAKSPSSSLPFSLYPSHTMSHPLVHSFIPLSSYFLVLFGLYSVWGGQSGSEEPITRDEGGRVSLSIYTWNLFVCLFSLFSRYHPFASPSIFLPLPPSHTQSRQRRTNSSAETRQTCWHALWDRKSVV